MKWIHPGCIQEGEKVVDRVEMYHHLYDEYHVRSTELIVVQHF